MRNREFNQKQVNRYLIFTFGAAYLIQFLAAPLYRSNRSAAQLVLAAMMFVPAFGVLLSGADLKGMGWKPRIRKNIRPILFAWFGPLLLTAIGGILYFLLFPQHFDLSGSPAAIRIPWIFFSSFRFFMIYAMSPMDSTEN